jgi:asparagine synthase (glutamine-hydrolysing)
VGFNRFSIIDLSGGRKPMSNEDGIVWIVFNGEIYNFASWHQELIGRATGYARGQIRKPLFMPGKNWASGA